MSFDKSILETEQGQVMQQKFLGAFKEEYAKTTEKELEKETMDVYKELGKLKGSDDTEKSVVETLKWVALTDVWAEKGKNINEVIVKCKKKKKGVFIVLLIIAVILIFNNKKNG